LVECEYASNLILSHLLHLNTISSCIVNQWLIYVQIIGHAVVSGHDTASSILITLALDLGRPSLQIQIFSGAGFGLGFAIVI